MPAITVRNLSEETHRALKVRAAQHGRSTEAEIREILGAAVKPALGLGTALAAIGRSSEGIELIVKRDKRPARAISFES